jgi:translation initiation factor IF-2
MTYPGKGPDEPPPIDEFGVVNRKGIKKTKAVEEKEEAEAIAKKRAALKGRKQHLSTRDLLAVTIDEIVDEDQEDIAVIAPIVGPRARTVYTPSSGGSKRNLKRRKDLKQTQITTPRAAYRVVKMGAIITVAELAKQMSVKATELIKKLMTQGEMVTINSNIDFDTASLLATDYGFELKDTSTDITDIIKTKALSDYKASELVSRPPIVTVMGHVDHGKTSILDAIRQTKVASGEAGGITQHIGAYMVEKNGKKISFLDTPGHEAFSNMRARGAKVTDIVVLVVAADDGVMPQTLESIAHAREAEVPIIVAINKIDKPNVNFDRIYNELAAHGVQSEEWGGDTQFVKVSALQRLGIDDLLESVLLQAEVLDLKAFEAAPVEGRVIEAHLDKGRGPVSTIMVQNGTLRVGDFVVAGSEYGKVRAMYNHAGVSLVSAGPSTPAQVIGLSGVPASGDPVNAVEDEKTAKSAAEWRQAVSSSVYKSSAAKMDDFLSRIKSDGEIELPLIVKADTHGSIEAIVDAILKLNDNKKNIRNKIIHKGVGGITGSDISLAATSGAFILAFNVRAGKILEEDAERSGVPLKYFGIIYDIVDAVKALMAGKLPPIQSESILGRAQVKQPITVPKIGTVAGSSVIDGKITRNSFLRLIRDDVVIYDGKLKSLRRFKDDVKEVATGYECGISIEGYNDIKEGDVIEAYIIEETPATLDM